MSSEGTRIVRIELGPRSYDIVIASNAIGEIANRLIELFPGRRFGVVTDDNVAAAQLPRLTAALEEAGLNHVVVSVPAGERSKSLSGLETVVEGILAARLERGDVVIALGGGVVGDLAGFAAATTRRGMDFVQVPTSLLAQVDSSVGGKTGINSPQGKNLIGAFHQPRLVVSDLTALETLPKREFVAGYAEIAKHALIDDAEMFNWLESSLGEIMSGGPARAEAIARSCETKARFVAEDEREAGRRALLNLGHTFAHALEAATGYSDRLLHGEAVAVGCLTAHRFSAVLGLAPAADVERIASHFAAAGLPTGFKDIPGPLPSPPELMHLIAQDKKVSRGALTFILTRGIGQAFIARNVPAADVEGFLQGAAVA